MSSPFGGDPPQSPYSPYDEPSQPQQNKIKSSLFPQQLQPTIDQSQNPHQQAPLIQSALSQHIKKPTSVQSPEQSSFFTEQPQPTNAQIASPHEQPPIISQSFTYDIRKPTSVIRQAPTQNINDDVLIAYDNLVSHMTNMIQQSSNYSSITFSQELLDAISSLEYIQPSFGKTANKLRMIQERSNGIYRNECFHQVSDQKFRTSVCPRLHCGLCIFLSLCQEFGFIPEKVGIEIVCQHGNRMEIRIEDGQLHEVYQDKSQGEPFILSITEALQEGDLSPLDEDLQKALQIFIEKTPRKDQCILCMQQLERIDSVDPCCQLCRNCVIEHFFKCQKCPCCLRDYDYEERQIIVVIAQSIPEFQAQSVDYINTTLNKVCSLCHKQIDEESRQCDQCYQLFCQNCKRTMLNCRHCGFRFKMPDNLLPQVQIPPRHPFGR